ncbi:hypothetical protein BDR03DRAFT_939074 [Suillus americanus]|nr:hypothetical protein BDR03DRAFT_939074 [Suillus americanus]
MTIVLALLDWIGILYNGSYFLGLVKSVRRARSQDIHEARFCMHQRTQHVITDNDSNDKWSGEEWNYKQAKAYVAERPCACLLHYRWFLR